MIKEYFSNNKYLIVILLFFSCFFIYNLNFLYIGSYDTITNILMPITIINEKNFDFNEYSNVSEFYNNGEVIYPFTEVNGRLISFYPILTGILNLPVFIIAKQLGVDLYSFRLTLSKISSSLIASLAVVFIYLTLKQILRKPSTALFFTLIFAFATNIWALVSQGLWQHGPSILFISITLFLLFNNNKKYLPLTGIFLGLLVFNRPVNFLIAFLLLMYIFFNERKKFYLTFFLFLIPLITLFIYSYIYWGNFSSLGQGNKISEGFYGNLLGGLVGTLFSPARGLFVYTPIFIFSFIYLFYLLFSKKAEDIYKYLAIITIVILLTYSLWGDWYGGSGFFGYRFLTEILPLLVIFLVLTWKNYIKYKKSLIIIFFILLVYSIFIQIIGFSYFSSVDPYLISEINIHPEVVWDFKKSDIYYCLEKFWQ